MECLAWNVPNDVLSSGNDLDEGFKATVGWLLLQIANDANVPSWVEPNLLKSLFGDHQMWSVNQRDLEIASTGGRYKKFARADGKVAYE